MVNIVKFIGALLPLIVLSIDCNGEFIELSQYYRMPKLAETDDYDQCLQEVVPGEVAVFCMTRVVIKPDNSSDLWHLIKDFSNSKLHHNHALLERGICINKCRKLVQSIANSTVQSLRVPKFPINFPYIHDTTVLKDSVKDRARYGKLLDICINYKLNESYRLSAYTEIEACDKHNQPQDVDFLDKFFLALLIVLILLVILSSWYDQSINYKQDINHYKRHLGTRKKILLTSFSILRNWYRLTSHSQEQLSKDLRVFQAVRFWGMCIVIFGHIMSIFSYLPLQNPSKLEMANHNIFMTLVAEGKRFVQSFFVMGAFLLAVMVLRYAKSLKKPHGISFVLKAIVYRYVRLTPVYAFMILLHATWLAKLQDGPWWKIRVETERVFCRRNWWHNLLYINNYSEQMCFLQGWYLSCDFQLFILGNLLLLAIIRLKKNASQILAIAGVASMLIPVFFVYHDKLEGTFLNTLQVDRFFCLLDEFFIKSYTSLQVNLGNYLIGIIAAMIYLQLRKRNVNLGKKKWFNIVWYLMFPLAFGTLLLNSIFYIYDFEKPSLWMAAYFPLSKYIWGVYTCLLFFGLIFGVQPTMKRIFSHRIFEVLGRLTYSAYLAHMFIIKVTLFNIRSPNHFGFTDTVTTVISTVVLAYLMGLALCLILETPITALQKLMFTNMNVNSTNPTEKQSGPVVR